MSAPMAWTIRRAVPNDAPMLAVLVRKLAAAQGENAEKATARRIRRNMLEAGSDVTVLVAESVNGALLGYVSALPTHESSQGAVGLYVADLFVVDSHRRHGIGRALMGAIAALARDHGRSYLWWAAMAGNEDADSFYRQIADIREPVVAYAVTGDSFQTLCDEHETVEADVAAQDGWRA